MAIESKQIVLTKQINDMVYELMVKTTSDQVFVDDTTTLTEALQGVLDRVNNNKNSVEDLVKIVNNLEKSVSDVVNIITNKDDSPPINLKNGGLWFRIIRDNTPTSEQIINISI